MSSRGTTTSSLMHTYCCFRREPQVLCSMLNEIALLDSVAEKSLTGIETSPKETVSDAMERAAMRSSCRQTPRPESVLIQWLREGTFHCPRTLVRSPVRGVAR